MNNILSTKLQGIADLIKGIFASTKLSVETSLMDGTLVSFEPAMEMGASIFINSAEGKVAAPDGEHTLIDGQVVTVLNGMVSSITPKVEEVSPLAELQEILESRLSQDYVKSRVVKELEAKNADLETRLQAQGKVITELYDAVKLMAQSEPTQPTNNPIKKVGKDWDALNAALAQIKKAKSNN
jgi:hypothetical protein